MKKIMFKEQICFVTDRRVKSSEKNDEYNYYEIRHDDEGQGTPVTVEAAVCINFWGTLATKADLSKLPSVVEERFGKWYIEIKDSDDKGTNESEDECHLFYAACDYDLKIDELEEPIV